MPLFQRLSSFWALPDAEALKDMESWARQFESVLRTFPYVSPF